VPLYPAVFASALPLLTWGNAGIHPALVARPLLTAVAASLGLTLLIAALLNERQRAAFIATIVVLVLLTTDVRVTVALVAVAVVLLVEGLIRRGRPPIGADLVTRAMTGVAFITALAIGLDLYQEGALASAAADLSHPALPAHGLASPGQPDIYLLLLDAYPGDRAAARSSRFDADAFPADLDARGFEVVRDAHSNYLLTPLTLASMFSMRHLTDIPELGPPYGPRTTDWRRLQVVLDDARAIGILRAAGYEVTVLDGGYAHASLRHVDRFVEGFDPPELELALLRNTRVDVIMDGIAPGTVARLARARIDGTFTRIGEVAAEAHDRPRFVFAHVPAPHPPWVFEADGSPRNPTSVSMSGEPELSGQAELEAGFAQATYIGHQTVEAIDTIMAASAIPPVIVVMSDHGPAGGFSTIKPLSTDTDIRASSFMAALAPGHPDLLADRPTPVNLFAVLFDAYLDRHDERVPDSIWAWQNDSYLDAVEVPPITGWTQ
jgi:hypothetical protein